MINGATLQPVQASPSEFDWIDATKSRPVIRGTDIKVSQIASESELVGMSVADILEAHPHLTRHQVNAALAFYNDHREAIRQDWERSALLVAELEERFPSRFSG